MYMLADDRCRASVNGTFNLELSEVNRIVWKLQWLSDRLTTDPASSKESERVWKCLFNLSQSQSIPYIRAHHVRLVNVLSYTGLG